jgi:hypothetical protein
MKRLLSIAIATVVTMFVFQEGPTVDRALAWCLINCGPDLTGDWIGVGPGAGQVFVNISQNGDTYIIQIRNPTGMASGVFSGPYKDGMIVIGSMVGNIAVQPNGTLSFAGITLVRSKR